MYGYYVHINLLLLLHWNFCPFLKKNLYLSLIKTQRFTKKFLNTTCKYLDHDYEQEINVGGNSKMSCNTDGNWI